MSEDRALTGTLDEVIGDELHSGPNDMLTRWVVIAEFIDSNGDRYITREWQEQMARWDVDALMLYNDYDE